MLVTLGRRAAATDLVGALLECHERIRAMSTLATTLADREDLPADQAREAGLRVSRYFSEALPLHVRDEEESILPRLTGRTPALDDTLAEMHAQHESHGDPLGRLVALCSALGDEPEPALRSALREVAHPLEQELRRHLELEETRLFPEMRALLSADEQAAILRELRARRRTP